MSEITPTIRRRIWFYPGGSTPFVDEHAVNQKLWELEGYALWKALHS